MNWSQFILHRGDDFIRLFTAGESVSALSTAFGRIMKIEVMRVSRYLVTLKVTPVTHKSRLKTNPGKAGGNSAIISLPRAHLSLYHSELVVYE